MVAPLQAKDMPKGELVAILQLLLSPATAAMDSQFRQHSTRLRNSAVVAVESAEKACLAHIRSEGELSTIDTALQDRVVKAAYEAAAVDGLTAQVFPLLQNWPCHSDFEDLHILYKHCLLWFCLCVMCSLQLYRLCSFVIMTA